MTCHLLVFKEFVRRVQKRLSAVSRNGYVSDCFHWLNVRCRGEVSFRRFVAAFLFAPLGLCTLTAFSSSLIFSFGSIFATFKLGRSGAVRFAVSLPTIRFFGLIVHLHNGSVLPPSIGRAEEVAHHPHSNRFPTLRTPHCVVA